MGSSYSFRAVARHIPIRSVHEKNPVRLRVFHCSREDIIMKKIHLIGIVNIGLRVKIAVHIHLRMCHLCIFRMKYAFFITLSSSAA